MKDDNSAFPIYGSRANTDYACIRLGLTKPEYAAIHLKVPRSGDQEIDAMIRESRRMDFAGQALAGICYEYFSNDFNKGSAKTDMRQITYCAYLIADAMLAGWEEEK